MTPSRDISRLLEIMKALRDPITGCPWDIEQDFASIRHYTIEEAYEVADAIEREDFEDLRDELGDLLLQPVYHAQMAEELGLFTFDDVVESITTKLIRRHPHVFGDQSANAAGEAKMRWEAIKSEERAQKAQSRNDGTDDTYSGSVLDDVPRALPALSRAQKLDKRAAAVGFDWPDAAAVLDKCREELTEVQEAIEQKNTSKINEEVGDLLFAVTSLARHVGIDAEAALTAANAKFIRRFKHVEQRCNEDEIAIDQAGMERLDGYWNEVREADNQAASEVK